MSQTESLRTCIVCYILPFFISSALVVFLLHYISVPCSLPVKKFYSTRVPMGMRMPPVCALHRLMKFTIIY